MIGSCLHPGGLEFTAQLLQGTNLSPGVNVLDAGCGDGLTVHWLLERGFKAYGIDREPAQRTEQICQGSLQQLPYADHMFAAVFSECTAFICGDTKQMLQECHRVLKPGGWFLLSDVFFLETTATPSFIDGRPATLPQWRRLLVQSGFTVREIQDVSEAWKPFVLEQLWAGKTLADLWGGCWSKEQASDKLPKPQYFLLWAQKGGDTDGRRTGFYDAHAGIDGAGL